MDFDFILDTDFNYPKLARSLHSTCASLKTNLHKTVLSYMPLFHIQFYIQF